MRKGRQNAGILAALGSRRDDDQTGSLDSSTLPNRESEGGGLCGAATQACSIVKTSMSGWCDDSPDAGGRRLFDDDPSFNKQRAVHRTSAAVHQRLIALSLIPSRTYAHRASSLARLHFFWRDKLLKGLHGLGSRSKPNGGQLRRMRSFCRGGEVLCIAFPGNGLRRRLRGQLGPSIVSYSEFFRPPTGHRFLVVFSNLVRFLGRSFSPLASNRPAIIFSYRRTI
jgi:hypothetical protein